VIILNLIENEAKRVFLSYGIPIPKGRLIADSKQVADAAANLRAPYMVKAQVPTGGRGKAGGIIPALTIEQANEAVSRLLGSQIKGLPVKQVLIEEKLPIKNELYIGFTVDRSNRSYVCLSSAVGGVEIEETANKTPEAVVKTTVDPQLGMRSFHTLNIAKQLGYSGIQLLDLSNTILKAYRACIESDAETAEINPLVETQSGTFVAADARMVVDDNAMFRHTEYLEKQTEGLTGQEALAKKNNLAYVKLDGDIGVMGNGAGLVMATIDLLKLFGGKPADFLDVGGGANTEAIKVATQIVLADPDVKVVMVNILGGITRCDEVARGAVEALEDAEVKKPLVVRLVGTNQREGQKILEDAQVSVLKSMEETAKKAVELAAGENS